MAISYVNTIEVENIAKDLISLANELDKEFNNLFTRFLEVPLVTREWVGHQAQFYFNKISVDKKQYNDFISRLRDIGNKLNSDVYEIQNCMNRCNNEEFQKGN